MMSTTGFTVGIVTALVNPELLSSEPTLRKLGWQQMSGTPLEDRAGITSWTKTRGELSATIKTAAIGEMGQAHAAIEAFAFLERARPTIVFLCGICGSLDEAKFKKEDVIVARSVSWKSFNKLMEGDLFSCFREKEFRTPSSSRDFEKWFSTYFARNLDKVKRDFDLHYEDVFTWDYVTTGSRATDKVRALSPTAACVEMEAGGFLVAVNRFAEIRDRRIPTFVVRGVSDYTIQKDKDSRVRKRASENAVEIAAEMAEHFLLHDDKLINQWT
jgi:nucleoside phosphorylase